MKNPAPGFRNECLILFYAIRHRSVPLLPKAVAGFSLVYLLSPVDIIPDFIPFAGWVDDLVIVPLLLHLSYRLLPSAVVQECRMRAIGQKRRFWRFAWVLIALIVLLMSAGFWFYHTWK